MANYCGARQQSAPCRLHLCRLVNRLDEMQPFCSLNLKMAPRHVVNDVRRVLAFGIASGVLTPADRFIAFIPEERTELAFAPGALLTCVHPAATVQSAINLSTDRSEMRTERPTRTACSRPDQSSDQPTCHSRPGGRRFVSWLGM